MENKNGFWSRAAICAAVVLAAVGCLPLTAHALAPSKGYNIAVTPSGKNFQLKYASDGTPMATVQPAAGGVVPVTQTVNVNLTPIKTASVIATGVITGAAVGGAVGAVIGGLGALAVATMPGFVELFQRRGVAIDPDGTFKKTDPTVCTVAPCFSYKFRTAALSGSYVAACQNGVGLGQSTGYGWATYTSVISSSPDNCRFVMSYNGGSLNSDFLALTKTAQTPAATALVPATQAEFVEAISLATPTQAEVQALVDALYPPAVTTPTLTGPARVFVGNTVEMFSPSEKRTIEEWKNLDYSTPGEVKVQTEKKTTVTSDATTSSTTTTNSDGSTSVSTTTTPATSKIETTTDEDEKPPEDACKLFPLRAGCMDVDIPTGEIRKSTKTITFTEESVFGAGSCPANLTANIATLGQTVTVWDWTKTCNLALPLRALVLLLATFAAFLIVMPGSTRT